MTGGFWVERSAGSCVSTWVVVPGGEAGEFFGGGLP